MIPILIIKILRGWPFGTTLGLASGVRTSGLPGFIVHLTSIWSLPGNGHHFKEVVQLGSYEPSLREKSTSFEFLLNYELIHLSNKSKILTTNPNFNADWIQVHWLQVWSCTNSVTALWLLFLKQSPVSYFHWFCQIELNESISQTN